MDYYALKRLAGQLFQCDADLFHTHELMELILIQPSLGMAIKTDRMESGPYALLTVLNLHKHKVRGIVFLVKYFTDLEGSGPPVYQGSGTLFLGQVLGRPGFPCYPTRTLLADRVSHWLCAVRMAHQHACVGSNILNH